MIKAEELLDKIRSQNEVYNALKYQILTLKAEPGEMLSENIISAQMNAGSEGCSCPVDRGRLCCCLSPEGNGCFYD